MAGPKEFIPVWLHVRLASTLQLYSQMKANGSGRRAEFIAIKSSMTAVMAAVIYVYQSGEGREYTADSAGSTWRQYISTDLSGTTKCSTVQCCRATKAESFLVLYFIRFEGSLYLRTFYARLSVCPSVPYFKFDPILKLLLLTKLLLRYSR